MTERESLVKEVADLAGRRGHSVATAESLTSGAIASALGQGADAQTWFAGSVVAYQERVKFRLLGVPEGPVVTAECAKQMALASRALLRAEYAVSATGVGGPEPSEGEPPGTVWLSASNGSVTLTRKVQLDGEPADVVEGTVDEALRLLLEVLRD